MINLFCLNADIAEAMGSTTVDLGFLETEFESWEVESRHFPSKVGGRPAWLDMEHLPATQLLACPHCGQPRVFLLQVCRLELETKVVEDCA